MARHPILERLHHRRVRHAERSRTYRVAFAGIGFLFVLAGLVGVALPIIPGFPLLFPGLAMLALEFAWAERLLVRAVERWERLKARNGRRTIDE